jgi:hypothetical protein
MTKWIQPTITDNTSYGIITCTDNVSSENANYAPFRALDNNTSSWWQVGKDSAGITLQTAFWQWMLPEKIKIHSISITNRTTLRPNLTVSIYTSSDKTTQIGDTLTFTALNTTLTASISDAAGIDTNTIYLDCSSTEPWMGITEITIDAETIVVEKVIEPIDSAIINNKLILSHFNNSFTDTSNNKRWYDNRYYTVPVSVLGGKQIFTIELTISTDEIRQQSSFLQAATLCGFASNGGNSGNFGITTNNGYLGFWNGLGTEGGINTTDFIADGQIHHIQLVSDGTKLILYKEGVPYSTTFPVSRGIDSAVAINIGNCIPYYDWPCRFQLYEARFWDIALTSDQFNAEIIDSTNVNLRAWYKNDPLLITEDITLTDLSIYKTNATVVAPASLQTAQKQLGIRSLYLDGTNYGFIYTSAKDFNFSDNDFTIDWWEYRLNNNSYCNSISFQPIADNKTANALIFGHSYNGALRLYLTKDGSGWNIADSVKLGNLLPNQWVHRAVVRNGPHFYCFENGKIISTFDTFEKLYFNSNWNVYIGAWNGGRFNGYIDELRITKDLARWTSEFTPSTVEYIADTLLIPQLNNIIYNPSLVSSYSDNNSNIIISPEIIATYNFNDTGITSNPNIVATYSHFNDCINISPIILVSYTEKKMKQIYISINKHIAIPVYSKAQTTDNNILIPKDSKMEME